MSLTGKQQRQPQQNGNAWGDVLAKKKKKRGMQVVYLCAQSWQMTSVFMDTISVFDQRLSCSSQALKKYHAHTCAEAELECVAVLMI